MTSPSKPLIMNPKLDAESIPTFRRGSAEKKSKNVLLLLPAPLRGVISMLLYGLNTIFWCVFLFLVAIIKAMIPNQWFRMQCNRILNAIANAWVKGNIINQKLTADTCWDVRGVEDLKPRSWYMIVANHQSWVDIFVLQKIFYKKIPFIKFFLKKELIWVPFMGLAWWALEFPFMKRYSKAFLRKNPHLMGKDLEITRKACEKFKQIPISIMTFPEGTRFDNEKHSRQKSPHKHLLRPKAGGLSFTLAAMGEQLNSLLDVTIVYPQGSKSFWDFACGRVREITVRVRSIPLGENNLGDYANNVDFKRKFQHWLNELWVEKDARIEYLLP